MFSKCVLDLARKQLEQGEVSTEPVWNGGVPLPVFEQLVVLKEATRRSNVMVRGRLCAFLYTKNT